MLNETALKVYNQFSGIIPGQYQVFYSVAVFTILLGLIAIFIWKFYRFFARRDILELNLSQYNKSEHPFWNKLIAVLFFFLEYILILPILTFFWFLFMAAFILILAKGLGTQQILLTAAAIVGAVRITAYFHEDLSKDMAKMFPFTILAIFLVNREGINIGEIIGKAFQVPSLFTHVLSYLIFLMALELVLRFFYFVSPEANSGEEENKEEE